MDQMINEMAEATPEGGPFFEMLKNMQDTDRCGN